MSVLAVVPARSGSKGLPAKNIRNLNGKPLLAWSIEHALSCKFVDKVVVTTDSREIASIAEAHGAAVPFLRPEHLASDTASTADVLLHTINELERAGDVYDYLLLLEPTSPLREPEDLISAYEKLGATPSAKSIVGVSRVESQHPEFCVTIDSSGFIHSNNNFRVLRRQEITELYFYEGSLYLSEVGFFKQRKSFYHEFALAYEMPKWKAFEIDDLVDFFIVEALQKNKESIKNGLL